MACGENQKVEGSGNLANFGGQSVGSTIDTSDPWKRDYANYFANTQPGTKQDYAGGTLEMLNPTDSGLWQAKYTDPTGQSQVLNPTHTRTQLEQSNPYLADIYRQTYDMGASKGQSQPLAGSSAGAGYGGASQPAQPMQTGVGGNGNPNLDSVVQNMYRQAQTAYDRNTAPQIRAGAVSTGGFGGSRQGIAEGIAQGDMLRGVGDAAANMYANSWESQQGRNLQQALQNQQLGFQGMALDKNLGANRYQFDKQFGEGQRQYDIGQQNWQDQFGMQNLLAGQQLSNQAAMLPYQQLQILAGLGGQMNAYDQALMDSDMNNFLRYASVVQPGAGLGASQIATGPAGSKGAGILGGALGGAAMGGQYGGPWGALGGGLLGGFLGGG